MTITSSNFTLVHTYTEKMLWVDSHRRLLFKGKLSMNADAIPRQHSKGCYLLDPIVTPQPPSHYIIVAFFLFHDGLYDSALLFYTHGNKTVFTVSPY